MTRAAGIRPKTPWSQVQCLNHSATYSAINSKKSYDMIGVLGHCALVRLNWAVDNLGIYSKEKDCVWQNDTTLYSKVVPHYYDAIERRQIAPHLDNLHRQYEFRVFGNGWHETLLIYYMATNALDWYKPVLHSNLYDNPSMKWNDRCFRPWFCTVRLYWAGDNMGKWDNPSI